MSGNATSDTMEQLKRNVSKASFSRPAINVENRVESPTLITTTMARENWRARYITDTASGTKVSEDNALNIDTVFTCARVLAESIAALPLDLMQTTGKGEKTTIKQAVDHPIYDLLKHQPNEETTSYELRLWMMIDCLIRGRGAAQVQRDGRGVPVALWQLESRLLCPKRAPDDNRLVYTYSYVEDGVKQELMFEKDEILQIQMMPYGGLIGYCIIQAQREALGAAKAAEQYSSEFFANGGAVTGVIEVPETLDEDAYRRLKKDWKESHTKKGKRHGVPILEGDAKFHALSLNHEETQLLETRKFQRSTVAGLFRVPAHMINDLEKATFSNIEHQDLGFAKHTLRPWLTNWEQRLLITLLTKDERRKYFFKHNDRDLLRGDFPSRSAAYSQLIQCGVMSPNDARRAEDMNPYDGGDVYLVNGTLRDINSPSPTVTSQPSVQPSPQPRE